MTKNIPQFTIKEMLESGVHYGHKKRRWNPQMANFIYGSKGDLHIIDLTKTYKMLQGALKVIESVASKNGKIIFVGTKQQLEHPIKENAEKCKQHYVNHRWLGGMLTNWNTVSESIKNLKAIEEELAKEDSELTKKERLGLSKKQEKLSLSLNGIRNLTGTPSLMIVFDTNKEAIAVQEAKKLDIPVIAIVDTNSSLTGINYPIPGNDDSAKACSFFCNLFAETINKSRNVANDEKDEKIEKDKKVEAKKETVKKEEKPAETAKKTSEKTEAKTEKKETTKSKETKKETVKKAPAKKAETKATTAKKVEDKKETKK